MSRKSRKAVDNNVTQTTAKVYNTAIYARLSVENSGKDDGGAALETQIAVCEEYIKSQPDLQLTDTYADNGKTGTVFDRPAFNRLMDDVSSGRISCVAVRDLSRFGRDYVETGTYLDRIFPRLGVRFIAVKENYDSAADSSSESLMVPLQNLINDLYSKDISRKVSTALRTQMENGDFRWRKVPYGYRWNDNRTNIVPDENTAKFVRSIFEWKIEGVSVPKILDQLEKANAPIPETLQRVSGMEGVNTMHWSDSTIHEMLKNPAYCGDFVVGRSRQAIYSGMKETQIKNPEEWYITREAHEPLVSREDFEKVQQIMREASEARAAKMEASKKQREKLVDLFDKKVFCADCGRRMYFHRHKINKDKRGRWHAYYECLPRRGQVCTAHRTRQDVLENKVISAVKLHIKTALDYEKLLTKLRASAAEKDMRSQLNNSISSVSLKLRGLSGKRTRLYEDYANGVLDEEEYTFAKRTYDARFELLNSQLDELTKRKKEYTEALSPDNKWIRLMKKARRTDRLNKELADSVIEKILIHEGGKIEIFFKYHDVFELTKKYITMLNGGKIA